MKWLLRMLSGWRRPEKSVLAWKEISQAPDEPALFYEDGRSRRARLTRVGFDVPDRAKLSMTRQGPARILKIGAKRD